MENVTRNYVANRTLKIFETGNIKLFQMVWDGKVVSGNWDASTKRVVAGPIWLSKEDTTEIENFLSRCDLDNC